MTHDTTGAGALAARIISAPVASLDTNDRFAEWLVEIEPSVSGQIQNLIAHYPLVGLNLQGIADYSPYLFDLIRADPARLLCVLLDDPDVHMGDLLKHLDQAVDASASEVDAMISLRRAKAEAALLIALCDIGGVWPVRTVTSALTQLADRSVACAVRFLLRQEADKKRLLPRNASLIEEGTGLIVLAMGKMGAGELNYSSDIDLIVFYDPARANLADGVEPSTFFVRIGQGISRMLQQRTGDGYVFRVDLRLRPDPSSTPLAISIAAALNYYERDGRTWERAAMIKARPCAGDLEAGQSFLAELSPFVWRKHLDFASLTDVHDMKRQMQAFRGQTDVAIEGYNVKVGPGGIREIEFFVQTQQLIAGGRHPELRIKATPDALNALAESNWITLQARDELLAAYEFLRRVEHRIQMIDDEQTQTLPDSIEAVERFARFLGFPDRTSFATTLAAHLDCVQQHYGRLFEGDPAGTAKLPDIDYAAGPDDLRLQQYLLGLGYKAPKAVAKQLKTWMADDLRAFRTDASRSAFRDFIPELVRGLARADNPDEAIASFGDFASNLQSGARLIALLSQNKELVALLALILGTAPRLGETLAKRPQILDGLVDPRFFGAMPDRSELSARLAATLGDANSYEEFLDRLRMFGQESLFLIGARILSGTVSAQNASVAFADVAEGIVRTVHRLSLERFTEQYGRIAGQETAIVAMGKFGGREMTASSDLDLILIYDYEEGKPDSDGEKSLQGGQYFARYTQRLISAFTTRTNYGVLYDVDMRLRPSGRAGPLASRIGAFRDYQNDEAWTWEHMALTRARVISSSEALRQNIEGVIRDILTRRRDASLVANDVCDMRQAIATEKGEGDVWDLKNAAGGLIDVEFIAQYLQLVHAAAHPDILDVNTMRAIDNAAKLGLIQPSAADTLRQAGRLYQDLTQILRLCLSGPFKPEIAGEGLLRSLARAGDAPDFSSLEARLRETQTDVRAAFQKIVSVN